MYFLFSARYKQLFAMLLPHNPLNLRTTAVAEEQGLGGERKALCLDESTTYLSCLSSTNRKWNRHRPNTPACHHTPINYLGLYCRCQHDGRRERQTKKLRTYKNSSCSSSRHMKFAERTLIGDPMSPPRAYICPLPAALIQAKTRQYNAWDLLKVKSENQPRY